MSFAGRGGGYGRGTPAAMGRTAAAKATAWQRGGEGGGMQRGGYGGEGGGIEPLPLIVQPAATRRRARSDHQSGGEPLQRANPSSRAAVSPASIANASSAALEPEQVHLVDAERRQADAVPPTYARQEQVQLVAPQQRCQCQARAYANQNKTRLVAAEQTAPCRRGAAYMADRNSTNSALCANNAAAGARRLMRPSEQQLRPAEQRAAGGRRGVRESQRNSSACPITEPVSRAGARRIREDGTTTACRTTYKRRACPAPAWGGLRQQQ